MVTWSFRPHDKRWYLFSVVCLLITLQLLPHAYVWLNNTALYRYTVRTPSDVGSALSNVSRAGLTDGMATPVLNYSFIEDIDAHLLEFNSTGRIPFLRNFKNPCWYSSPPENVSNMYEGNLMRFHSKKGRDHFLRDFRASRSQLMDSGRHLQMKCLPYLYIIGLPKCGTTALFCNLRKHPQIFRGKGKEYHWWNKGRMGKRFRDGTVIPLNDYVEMFDIAANNIANDCPRHTEQGYNPCLTFEASVSTLWLNPLHEVNEFGVEVTPEPDHMIPAALYKLQPQSKLMAILRNPVNRTYSDYLFFNPHRNTSTVDKFHKDCSMSVALFNECVPVNGLRQCTYNATLQQHMKVRLWIGIYHVFLRDWLSVWPRTQLLVFSLEQYSTEKRKTLNRITNYLEIDDFPEDLMRDLTVEKPINKLPIKSTGMLTETHKLLTDFYSTHNEMLIELLQDRRSLWT